MLVVAACGARTPVEVDGTGGAAGAGGTSSSSGPGATTSSGEGGGDSFDCPALAWAGDPISVTFGGTAASPRLVRTGAKEWAVVFESSDGGGELVASFAVDDAFGTWPPAIGSVDAHLPVGQRFAATRGDPGQIAFAVTDLAGSTVLAQSPPGANGCTFVDWPGPVGPIGFAARSPVGSYLLGRYAQAAGGTAMTIDLVSGFEPDPAVLELGALACSVDRVPADVAAAPGGGWFVASASQAPFDACAAASGPPRYVQIHRVEGAMVVDASASDDLGVLAEVLLASRTSGAWLGVHASGKNQLDVFPVSASGAIDFAQQWALVGEYTESARHALVATPDTWAAAELIPNERIPGGSLRVHVVSNQTTVSVSHDGAVVPSGVPTMVISDDADSFLVAFEDETGILPAIGLRRADCVLP